LPIGKVPVLKIDIRRTWCSYIAGIRVIRYGFNYIVFYGTKDYSAIGVKDPFPVILCYFCLAVPETIANSNIQRLDDFTPLVYQPPFPVVIYGCNGTLKIKYDLVLKGQYSFARFIDETPLVAFFNGGQFAVEVSCIFKLGRSNRNSGGIYKRELVVEEYPGKAICFRYMYSFLF